jgi:hypothetical protein
MIVVVEVVGRQCLLFVDKAIQQQDLLRSVYSF